MRTQHRARNEAHHSLAQRRRRFEGEESCHYRTGYYQAFEDIAEGRSGVTPAIPPPRYWSDCYRTAEGHARAAEWFAGYRAGSADARLAGLQEFNFVPTSYHGHSDQGHEPACGSSPVSQAGGLVGPSVAMSYVSGS